MATAAKVVVGIALLAWLFGSLDREPALEAIRAADLTLVGWSFVVFLLVSAFEALRLYLSLLRFRLSFRACVEMVIAGLFIGNFLPGILGADGYKVYFLRERATMAAGMALVFGGRMVSVALSAMLVGGFLLFEWSRLGSLLTQNVPAIGVKGSLIGGIFFLVIAGSAAVILAGSELRRKLVQRLQAGRQEASTAFRELNRGQLIGVLVASTGVLLARAGSYDLALRSFGIPVSFLDILFVSNLVTLVSILPFTIGSIGVRESATVVLLALFGVPAPIGGMVAIANRLFVWLLSLPGGFLVLRRRRDS